MRDEKTPLSGRSWQVTNLRKAINDDGGGQRCVGWTDGGVTTHLLACGWCWSAYFHGEVSDFRAPFPLASRLDPLSPRGANELAGRADTASTPRLHPISAFVPFPSDR